MKSLSLPPALRLLLVYQMRARLRKLARAAKTVKGALALCVLFGMVLFMLGSAVIASFVVPRSAIAIGPTFISPALLAFCVLAVITTGPESGIFFFPAEVDLLFPAPFHRRQLLLYRLSGLGIGVLLVSLYFSVFLLFVARYWFFGFFGCLLALIFIQLLPMTLALVLSIVGARAYSRGRKLALAGFFVLAALAAGQAVGNRSAGGIVAFVAQVRSSGVGTSLLAPFDVFSRTIGAESFFPAFVGWGTLALAIDAVLVGLILRLDADFLESSVTASQRLYARIERARRGQLWSNLSAPSAARWRIPVLPRWAGAGPIAWRHFVTALRGSRGMLILVAMLAGGMLLPVLFLERDELTAVAAMVGGLAPYICFFILPQLLQFDFRGDLDGMDLLKTLPLPPLAVAAGELATPVVVATAMELPLALIAAVAWADWRLFVAALAIIPALNLMVFAIENLAFLWFPYRMQALGGADFQSFGRQMLIMFVKFGVVLFGAGAAAAVGGLAWWLAGQSWTAFGLAAWLVLALIGLSLIPLVALAFKNFDPGLDKAE